MLINHAATKSIFDIIDEETNNWTFRGVHNQRAEFREQQSCLTYAHLIHRVYKESLYHFSYFT